MHPCALSYIPVLVLLPFYWRSALSCIPGHSHDPSALSYIPVLVLLPFYCHSALSFIPGHSHGPSALSYIPVLVLLPFYCHSTAGSDPILLLFYCWFCSHSTVIALLMYITSLIGCWLSCIPFVCIYVCMHVLCVGEVNCVGNSHLTLTLAFLQNN